MRVIAVEPILLRGEQAYRATEGREEAVNNGDWQLLIKVTTDEGLVGWSDVETLPSVAAACIQGPGLSVLGFRALKDLLIGQNPLDDPKEIWNKLYIGTCYYGRRGVALHCISAIDNCLWSIRAQAAGVSLGELLRRHDRAHVARKQGHISRIEMATLAACDRVTAYASTLFRETPQAMFAAARGYVKHIA